MLLFILAALSASCFQLFDGEWSFDEVSRVTSLSGKVDAVLVERNGGATTSFGYEVFVVSRGKAVTKGSEIASLYGAVRSDQAYGVNLKWEGSNRLVIEYLKHRGAELKKPISTIDGEQVSAVFRSDVNDPTAPPGGMLYNLKQGK